MIRLPTITWLKDRTHTDFGDAIDTPALRGFAMIESSIPDPAVPGRPGTIFREEVIVLHRDRENVGVVAEAVGKAFLRIARMATQPPRTAVPGLPEEP
jgi:hypothetical protein